MNSRFIFSPRLHYYIIASSEPISFLSSLDIYQVYYRKNHAEEVILLSVYKYEGVNIEHKETDQVIGK